MEERFIANGKTHTAVLVRGNGVIRSRAFLDGKPANGRHFEMDIYQPNAPKGTTDQTIDHYMLGLAKQSVLRV